MDENVGIFEFDLELLRIRDEIGREIAAVELHALHSLEFGRKALGFLDGDHALVADLLHRLGENAADFLVAVRGDGRDLGDLAVGADLASMGFEVPDHGADGEIDAALEVHRVHAGGDRLRAFAHDRLGKHGGCSSAVAGLVVLLRRNLAQHLRAHVLELVLEFDFLGDGDAVLGDARRAERFLDDHIAALRTQGHLHCVGQRIHAAQHAITRVGRKLDFLGSHCLVSFLRFPSTCQRMQVAVRRPA